MWLPSSTQALVLAALTIIAGLLYALGLLQARRRHGVVLFGLALAFFHFAALEAYTWATKHWQLSDLELAAYWLAATLAALLVAVVMRARRH